MEATDALVLALIENYLHSRKKVNLQKPTVLPKGTPTLLEVCSHFLKTSPDGEELKNVICILKKQGKAGASSSDSSTDEQSLPKKQANAGASSSDSSIEEESPPKRRAANPAPRKKSLSLDDTLERVVPKDKPMLIEVCSRIFKTCLNQLKNLIIVLEHAVIPQASEEESCDDSSSSEESAKIVVNATTNELVAEVVLAKLLKPAAKKEKSSSSDDSSEDQAYKKLVTPKVAPPAIQTKKAECSSEGSDTDDEPLAKKHAVQLSKSSNEESSSPEDSSEEEEKTVKEVKAEEKLDEKVEPERCRKLFIGSLDYRTTDESLKKHFEQWGDIVKVVVMKDPKTRRSRGFGFITYSCAHMVEEAQSARPHRVDGRMVESKRAVPRQDIGQPGAGATIQKLFVGGLRAEVEEEDLRETFSQFGTILSCAIVRSRDTGEKRSFGFITFADYDSVDKICLHGNYVVKGKQVDVKRALSRAEMEKAGSCNIGGVSACGSGVRGGRPQVVDRNNGRGGGNWDGNRGSGAGSGGWSGPISWDNYNFNSSGGNNQSGS